MEFVAEFAIHHAFVVHAQVSTACCVCCSRVYPATANFSFAASRYFLLAFAGAGCLFFTFAGAGRFLFAARSFRFLAAAFGFLLAAFAVGHAGGRDKKT